MVCRVKPQLSFKIKKTIFVGTTNKAKNMRFIGMGNEKRTSTQSWFSGKLKYRIVIVISPSTSSV